MPSPEVQRILLLVGLAVVGYMLILAWNEDYMGSPGIESLPQAPTSAVTTPSAGDLPVATNDLPAAGPVVDSTDLDVPQPDAAAGPADTPVGEITAGRLITVFTPVQKVWIDLVGGDIVRIELPQHPLEIDKPEGAYLLLNNTGGYTYVAQSGLVGPDGLDSGGARPVYEAAKTSYVLDETGDLTVSLTAHSDTASVTKSFVFRADDYLVDVRYEVVNRLDRPLQAGLFTQLKRDDREPFGGGGFSMGPQPYVGGAMTTPETRYQKLEFDDIEEASFTETVTGGWIAFLQHYFVAAWVANPEEDNRYYANKRADGLYRFGYTAPVKSIGVGAKGEYATQFYAGPKDQKRLEQIAPNLELTIDYGFLWWLALPLYSLLDFFHGLLGNWGLAIIALTFGVKLVLYPLSAASYKSMANMRRVGPQMKRLQERYADDRQKLSQEMMALYKKEKVNPLGGCLPMLLPMPIFIALYWVLFESVELRHAPFFLWIDDLAAMDPFFVLPLLMGASMYFQQTLSPAVGDPMQVKMMKMMPIMFTVLFLFFPAGLVLYWLVNNLLGIAQQYYVIKKTEAAGT
jgi:YidC/Oxa1 family membrane protein insertase